MSPTTGQFLGKIVLGRYRVVHGLARGGMGEIYLARSEGAAGFAKPVVVKRILSEFQTDDTVVQMFKREARIMSNLHHPGIVSVLDFGYEDGSYFMVLEYVHGLHAGRWKKFVHGLKQPFPVERAVQIVLSVLEALDYAHKLCDAEGRPLHIVHRDISPSNVLIDVDGHVKLADFGIARMQSTDVEWKTQDLSVKGKFPYLPPEIFSGEKADARTDVYAAAVVLHELIAGANEFRADTASESIAKVLGLVPRRLDAIRKDVPKGVADAVHKALAKKQEDRFQSAAEFAEALRRGRSLTGEVGAREIAASAREDFYDPRMHGLLGVDPLAVLERAWRNPSPVVSPAEAAASVRRMSSAPTSVSTPPPLPPVTKDRSPIALWLVAGASLLALAIAGAVAYKLFLVDSSGAAANEVAAQQGDCVVGQDGIIRCGEGVAAPPASPAPTAPPEPVAAAPTTPVDQAPPEARPEEPTAPSASPVAPPRAPATKVAPAPAAERIETPFRRRAPEIQGCFTRHVESLAGTPQITVRFELAANGHVDDASMEPAALSATPLGSCILGIARSTRFAARDEGVVFRVPLSARTQ
jgi:serine/threonine protein kinase